MWKNNFTAEFRQTFAKTVKKFLEILEVGDFTEFLINYEIVFRKFSETFEKIWRKFGLVIKTFTESLENFLRFNSEQILRKVIGKF